MSTYVAKYRAGPLHCVSSTVEKANLQKKVDDDKADHDEKKKLLLKRSKKRKWFQRRKMKPLYRLLMLLKCAIFQPFVLRLNAKGEQPQVEFPEVLSPRY
jgi:hypothetical protein